MVNTETPQRKHFQRRLQKAIILMVMLTISMTLAPPQSNLVAGSVSTGWAFPGFLYRIEHNITSTATMQTDYQVPLNVYYGNGTGSWTIKTPMPFEFADFPAVTYNGKIYTFGGYKNGANSVQKNTLQYDPGTDSWTTKADMPTARWGAAATLFGGLIYVFAGAVNVNLGGTTAAEAYNPTSNSWTSKTPTPTDLAHEGLTSETVGNFIYLFNDHFVYRFDPTGNGGSGSYTELTAFAPVNRHWTTSAYVRVNGQDRIYLMGGWNQFNGSATAANYYWNVSNSVWSSQQAPAPYAAYGGSRDNPVDNGLIYYTLGFNNTYFYNSLYTYNPSTNTWSTPLNSPSYSRDGFGGVFVGSDYYAVGGRNRYPDPLGLDFNEVYHVGAASNYKNNVYLKGQSRADFGDIRFSWYNSTSHSEIPLNCWIQSSTTSYKATIWIKIPTLATGTNTIYLYFGKSDATTTSSGANTFPLFDDFNRADSSTIGNGWSKDVDTSHGGTVTISNNQLRITQSQNLYAHINQIPPSLATFVFQGMIKTGTSASSIGFLPGLIAQWGINDWIMAGKEESTNAGYGEWNIGGSDTYVHNGTAVINVYYYYRIRASSNTISVEFSQDGVGWLTIETINRPSSWTGVPAYLIVGKGYSYNPGYTSPNWDNSYATAGPMGTHYADNVLMRKYVNPGPKDGAWGTQQTSGAAPGTPTGLSATGGINQVALSWKAPSNNSGSAITGYKLFRSTSSGSETLYQVLGNMTSYIDTSVASATTYYYKVSALNGFGESAESSEASATTASVPTAPQNLTQTTTLRVRNSTTTTVTTSTTTQTTVIGGNQTITITSTVTTTSTSTIATLRNVTLTWQPPNSNGGGPISGYRLYRGTTSDGETLYQTLGNVTTYTDHIVNSSTTYFYRVTAFNAVGEGAYSNEAFSQQPTYTPLITQTNSITTATPITTPNKGIPSPLKGTTGTPSTSTGTNLIQIGLETSAAAVLIGSAYLALRSGLRRNRSAKRIIDINSTNSPTNGSEQSSDSNSILENQTSKPI